MRDFCTVGGMSPFETHGWKPERSPDGLIIMEEKSLIPDAVNGTLTSSAAPLPARNEGKVPFEI